jgi:hypothetical protein|tara:strand:+ start:811 stop:978 length:168 start_codon:yes stop_codon:yes gene_type:complete
MKEVDINSLPITQKQWAFIMKVRDDLNMTTNEIMVYLIQEGIKEMTYRRGLHDTE